MEAVDPILAPWSAYYTITGSSAAALIGLMFVVVTLIRDQEQRRQAAPDGVAIFSTPTVIHFAVALFLSASLCAPWHSLTGPAVLIVCAGLVGGAYVGRAVYRTRHMRDYRPDTEDVIYFAAAPMVAYLALVIAGLLLVRFEHSALFAAAALVVMLILLGIRNSWDVITFLATNPAGGE